MIVELNNDIEQNNIQGSLLFDHFVNLLRNYNFFTSLLGHQSARPADYESGGQRFEISLGATVYETSRVNRTAFTRSKPDAT